MKRGKGADSIRRDVDFLFEMGTFRHVARTWSQFGGSPMANNAEHTFRTAMIAWVLAEYEGADTGHVAKMALIHDTLETRTGDVQYMSRLYVDRHEEKAITDQTAGIAMQNEMRTLMAEYIARETLEAKILKDADTLDIDMEIMESIARGETVGEAFYRPRDPVIRDKLYTDTAKRFWDVIRTTNPHDWHIKGANRFTSGDWKKQ